MHASDATALLGKLQRGLMLREDGSWTPAHKLVGTVTTQRTAFLCLFIDVVELDAAGTPVAAYTEQSLRTSRVDVQWLQPDGTWLHAIYVDGARQSLRVATQWARQGVLPTAITFHLAQDAAKTQVHGTIEINV